MTQGKPVMPAKPVSEIKSAFAVDLNTGEKQELSVREGSYCHFFEPIEVSGYIVKFRLDWADVDKHGQPTLDADFFDSESGSKLKNNGDRHAAHHTQSSSPGARIYQWTFKTAGLHLKVSIHCMVNLEAGLGMSDAATIDVQRNEKNLDYE